MDVALISADLLGVRSAGISRESKFSPYTKGMPHSTCYVRMSSTTHNCICNRPIHDNIIWSWIPC